MLLALVVILLAVLWAVAFGTPEPPPYPQVLGGGVDSRATMNGGSGTGRSRLPRRP